MHRYPIQPLATALGIELGRIGAPNGWSTSDDEPAGRTALAEALDVSISTITRRMRTGLDEYEADRYAIRSGVHPTHLWPDWGTDLDSDEADDDYFTDDDQADDVDLEPADHHTAVAA